jgi:Mrp family chromosome partitioning ATPase
MYGIVRNRASSSLFTIGDVESVSRLPVVASIQEIAPPTSLFADEPIAAAARILGPIIDNIRALPADSLTLITSPSVGCGTSFIATAIALSLSSGEGDRSLRIEILPFDADAREKKEPYMEFSSNEDMATYDIRGRIIAGSKRRSDLLRVAAAPSAPPTPDLVAQFIRRIKDLGYSRPVLDISANRADPLYLSFAGYANALYVVAAYGKTNRYSLARMMNLLDRMGYKVNGCIFNRRVNVIPEILYQWL